MDLDVVLYSRFTRLESIAISIDQSATEAHERSSNQFRRRAFINCSEGSMTSIAKPVFCKGCFSPQQKPVIRSLLSIWMKSYLPFIFCCFLRILIGS